MEKLTIGIANQSHLVFVPRIEQAIIEASRVKGTGIARRSAEYLKEKIRQGKAIIAVSENSEFAGFCYIESWGHDRFVANSGLIVEQKYRGQGLALRIKAEAFRLSRKIFPSAKIFGLTTSLAVMKINSSLGYKPVTFSELTDDDEFWKGCQSCAYYDILFRTNRSLCLCTGMLYDPAIEKKGLLKKRQKNGKTLKKMSTEKSKQKNQKKT